MKTKIILSVIVIAMLSSCARAQFNLKSITNEITGSKGKLSNDDIVHGLKEALSVGTNKSSDAAAKVDGYYRNPKIKIPFPKEAQEMESTVRSLGLNKEADDFVMSLNRAAEEAAKKAAPIFLDAISKMTINDGVSILKGNNDAATQYLKGTSSAPLKSTFKPIVNAALQKVEVTKYWTPLVNAYDRVPFVTKVNPDLNEYVTQKAMDGLFLLIADEELKIRQNPEARVTDILKKVFGN